MLSETLAIQARLIAGYGDMAQLQKELTAEQVKDVQAAVSSGTLALTGLSAAAVIAAAILEFFITRSITRPLKAAVAVARNVASGDLTGKIEVTSRDESLLRSIAQTRQGVDAIMTASGQVAAGNLDLSSRTEQQAGSLEETASSVSELTSTVKQNADNALQANQLASRASDIAASSGQVVSDVVETIQSISESASKISDIISVIDSIAFQTNVLALNAAEMNRALSEMNRVTQQNAALVEEAAAAASSLDEQAASLSVISNWATTVRLPYRRRARGPSRLRGGKRKTRLQSCHRLIRRAGNTGAWRTTGLGAWISGKRFDPGYDGRRSFPAGLTLWHQAARAVPARRKLPPLSCGRFGKEYAQAHRPTDLHKDFRSCA